MMVESEDLHVFLEGLCGTNTYPLLLARDPDAPTGWRLWTSEDTEALCAWLSARVDEHVGDPSRTVCYNAKEAAVVLGVSVPTLQVWLKS